MMKFFRNVVASIVLAVGCLSSTYAMEVVNINHDSIRQIAKTLKGVGVKRAAAIVRYRKENGDFQSIDDLKKVEGINQKIIDANRQRIELEKMEESTSD